ncbi:pteridine reductase [Novilysobacter spongiicola]|uniref:Pteridine reductase n=1 Tax=Lysobacter spongiicola DSM 21749 TaxID=1122188 RepID=A0A1T4RL80_9GAMM|nr:pteridine reductase [Lysobacter spongiicola]SKA16546.1 pteridine reductase [Lysobacter spongiicola DSM 21749]
MSARPVALVTGSARRIGAAIARTLHGAGFDLALHYRSSGSEAGALAAELEASRPGSAMLLQAELADFDRLPSMVESVVQRFGRLDALVNNASTFKPTPLGGIDPAQWDELFDSNARGPFFLAQAAAPHLQRSGAGAIVNIADIYGERPLPGHAVYCMAKASLLMMTRALAIDLGPAVRVNAVSPGAILWPEGDSGEDRQAMLARTPLGRTGEPGEVAEAVRWLLQDARYTTGQVLHLDGGRMLAV